jgi:hypothetical protein
VASKGVVVPVVASKCHKDWSDAWLLRRTSSRVLSVVA